MKDFKNTLLALLETDSDVKLAINNIVSTKRDDSHRLKELLSDLEEEDLMLEKLKKLFSVKDSDNESLQAEINHLKQVIKDETGKTSLLKTELKENQSQVKRYEQQFKDELAAYKLFENLSKDTQKSLRGIFKDDSLQGFLSCGIQERNIDNLWEYIKNEVIENKNKDISSLKSMFDFLFSHYVMAYPMYERQRVAKADDFDTQLHIKHTDSKNVSGKVKKVIFYGWVNKKQNKVIKRSVVEI